MQVGEAFVAVRPDTSKFGPELSRGVEQSGRSAASGLTQALTAGIAVKGFSTLVGAASDLTEAGNKVSATFGESAGQVEDFASTSAQSLGIAESAALDLAGGLGSMLVPLGISQEEAANMSTTMLQLAADMGSFNNQDPTEMLERIRSGLAGESEPLRQFGSNLSEARIQQFAWQEGIAESGVALTEQQKVMARYGLLLEDTSIQQGDFARTSGEAANAQRIAAATAQDSAAAIGENFLPVYKQGVAAVTALAAAFGALPGPAQTAVVLFAGFAAFKAPVTSAFSAIAESARGAGLRFKEAGGGAKGFASLISPGALGAVAAVGAIAILTQGLAENARRAEEARQRIKDLSDAFTEGGAAAAGDTLLTQIQDQVPEAVEALNAAGVSTRDLIDAAADGDGALENLVRRVGETGDLSRLSTIELGLLAQASSDAAASADELGTAQSANAEAAADNTDSLEDQATALSDVADSADAARDSLDALFGIQRGLNEANRAVQQTADDLNQSIRENGRRWREGTQAGRDNREAAEANAAAIVESTIAYRANGASVSDAAARHQFLIGGLRNTLRQAGLTKGEIDTLIATYGRVPRRVLSTIDANEEPALSALARARRDAEAWARMTYTAQAHIALSGALPGAAFGRSARGGPIGAGDIHLVGEEGPELFMPNNSGQIIPNDKLFSGNGSPILGGGGGNVTVIVEGNVIGDVDRFADEIAFRAAEKISRGAI